VSCGGRCGKRRQRCRNWLFNLRRSRSGARRPCNSHGRDSVMKRPKKRAVNAWYFVGFAIGITITIILISMGKA
jgi:hypothetical protein